MTLAEVVDELAQLDDELTVYAEEPWAATSRVVVARDTEDGIPPPEADGLAYLLEVFLIQEVLSVWSSQRAGRPPTSEQACAAVIHYARNDAFLMPEV